MRIGGRLPSPFNMSTPRLSAPIAQARPVDVQLSRGIISMLVAMGAFMLMNAFVKLAIEAYPFGQVLFLRSAFALIPAFCVLRWQGGLSTLRCGRTSTMCYLSALVVGSMVTSFWAYHLLPFADATFYSFVGPLMITALSAPMLGERVGVNRWSAVLLGFAGIVLITPPGQGALSLGVAIALLSAFLYAVGMVMIRRSSGSEHPLAIVFYFTLLATVVGALWLPLGWRQPDWYGWALMGGAGISGAIGQYQQTQAFRMAPPSLCGAVSYVRIVMAVALGYLIWGEVPLPITFLGSTIVIGSGLYLTYYEWRLRRSSQ
ncbi:EamA domain-containing protein [Bordetella tumbae]